VVGLGLEVGLGVRDGLAAAVGTDVGDSGVVGDGADVGDDCWVGDATADCVTGATAALPPQALSRASAPSPSARRQRVNLLMNRFNMFSSLGWQNSFYGSTSMRKFSIIWVTWSRPRFVADLALDRPTRGGVRADLTDGNQGVRSIASTMRVNGIPAASFTSRTTRGFSASKRHMTWASLGTQELRM
jgi:hypothetical protein